MRIQTHSKVLLLPLINLMGAPLLWGQRIWQPRPISYQAQGPHWKRKKCPRMNEEGPNCQETLLRTILSSINRDHGRKKRHAAKGSLPERPKEKHKCNESAMGVWWRSNSRRNCHLRIKCPQLTSWSHLCGHEPWTVLSGSPQLTERQKEWLMGQALK